MYVNITLCIKNYVFIPVPGMLPKVTSGGFFTTSIEHEEPSDDLVTMYWQVRGSSCNAQRKSDDMSTITWFHTNNVAQVVAI